MSLRISMPMICALFGFATSCNEERPESASQPVAVATNAALVADEGPVSPGDPVGTISVRGYRVHIFTNDVYTVENDDGETLARHIGPTQFWQQFPDLHAHVTGILDTYQGREFDRGLDRRWRLRRPSQQP